MENSIVLQDEMFYCEHLTDSAEVRELIDGFEIAVSTGRGLAQYLKKHAVKEESANQMRTYLIRDIKTKELVGYFSLKAGMASVNEKHFFRKARFDVIPGIELANFAVNDAYREKHKAYVGHGKIIYLNFIIPLAKEISEQLGAKMLYIYALPYQELLQYYKALGFERLPLLDEYRMHRRMKPRYDKRCIFMYRLIDNF